MRKMYLLFYAERRCENKNRYIMEVTDLYEDTFISLGCDKTWLIQRLCWDYWHPEDMR